MRKCTRCSEDIGITTGILDFIIHTFGAGLCENCKKERRKIEYDEQRRPRQKDEDDAAPFDRSIYLGENGKDMLTTQMKLSKRRRDL